MSLTRKARLSVEQLDERTLPSATVLNLGTSGAHVATAGFIANQITAPTGTINPFLRIQGNWFGGTEQGYNTNARPQFDETRQVTHALTLGQVPIVMVNGVAYREFLLDINQRGGSPYLSLDQLRIFLGNRANLDDYNSFTKTLNGHSAVFDMDAHGNVSLLLNGRLTKGDGFGDMSLLIPNSVFAGASPSTYVYLFSQFGATPGARANGGFEEWAVRTPTGGSTGGGSTGGGSTDTASLSGNVFIGGTQTGISGVTIQLTGTDSQGNSVVLTTTTDANGAFTFGNLKAGTYAISETQPSGYLQGGFSVGTVNGTADGNGSNDRFDTIVLGANQKGVSYNFTENVDLG